MTRKTRPALIGAFVLGALLLALAAAVLLGGGWLFRDVYRYVLYFDGSVNGLSEGAPVKFKGVEIGAVKQVLLYLDMGNDGPLLVGEEMLIPVIIEVDATHILSRGARRIDLEDPATLQRLIAAGLRAQLEPQSLLTGQLYVALDMHPGSPLRLVLPPGSEPREIPTLRSLLQEASAAAGEILARLKTIDFDRLAETTNQTVEAMNRLVTSPDLQESLSALNDVLTRAQDLVEQVDRRFAPFAASVEATNRETRQTLQQTQRTLAALESLIQPGAPLALQLDQALQDIARAAQAMRELADYLQRHPNAILFGRKR